MTMLKHVHPTREFCGGTLLGRLLAMCHHHLPPYSAIWFTLCSIAEATQQHQQKLCLIMLISLIYCWIL